MPSLLQVAYHVRKPTRRPNHHVCALGDELLVRVFGIGPTRHRHELDGGSVLGEGLGDGLLERDSMRALERQWMMGQGATPRKGSPLIGWLVGDGNDLLEGGYLVRGMTLSPGPRAADSSVCWCSRYENKTRFGARADAHSIASNSRGGRFGTWIASSLVGAMTKAPTSCLPHGSSLRSTISKAGIKKATVLPEPVQA